MFDAFVALGWASGIDAAVGGGSFVTDYAGGACGAEVRHAEGLLRAGAALFHGPDHVGNHFAGALDPDVVSDAEVFALDIVLVMEGRLAHGYSAYLHRLQNGVGIEATRASHVDSDVQQAGDHALRGEFVGDGPARLPPDEPQVALVVEVVDLHDDAIGLVVLASSFFHPSVVVGGNTVQRVEAFDLRVYPEAEFAQPLHRLPVRGRRLCVLYPSELVDPYRQLARGGYAWVQLPQRPGCRVAWVGEQRLFLFGAFIVEAGECVSGEVDLAAHFHAGRR